MRLYKALILPVLEYGAPIYVSAMVEPARNLVKFRGASGCLRNSSIEALEIFDKFPTY